MPQLDASTFSGQIFWLLILFSGLLFVMWRCILPRIRKTLENRESYVDILESKLRNNNSESDKLVGNARKELQDERLSIDRRFKELKVKMVRSFSDKKTLLYSEYKSNLKNDFAEIQKQTLDIEDELIRDILPLVINVCERVTGNVK